MGCYQKTLGQPASQDHHGQPGQIADGQIGQSVDLATRWLVVVYGFTIVADIPFVLLIALVERVAARIKGVRVEY